MKTRPLFMLMLSLLLLAAGCQHAVSPSVKMQEKFFAALEPANPQAEQTLQRVQYYQLAGRTDLALQEIQRGLNREPQNVRLLNAQGNCYDRQGEYAKAQESYSTILTHDPRNLLALNNLGYSFFLAGDLVQAEKRFQEILAHYPENTLARNNLGLVWCRQGKQQQALGLWEKHEGELSAREKLQQVMAHLGKPVQESVSRANNPTFPQTAPAYSARPPSHRNQTGDSARLASRPLHAGAGPAAPQTEAGQTDAARPAGASQSPAASPAKPGVTVEEVEMVIQPASASSPPQLTNSADRGVQELGPWRPAPELSQPGKDRRVRRLELNLEDETELDDSEATEFAQRSRPWPRQRRPKIITYGPPATPPPGKSLKEYISTGYSHRNHGAAGLKETAVY